MNNKKTRVIDETGQAKTQLKGWLTSVLRRASLRWYARSECIKRARVERGRYECAMCHDKEVKNGEFIIDHIIPMISIKDGFPFRENGLPDWNRIIDALFVTPEEMQLLCKTCSDSKTSVEDTLRAQYNQERKALEKEQKKQAKKKKLDNNQK